MNEQGKVVEQRPDGTVVIEVRRGAACEGCRAQNACGMGTHASSIKVVARNALGATVGQTVTLELDDSALLAACAWVYGVAVIGLAVGGGSWTRWEAAGGWRAPLAWWATGVAITWPFFAARDLGYSLAPSIAAGPIVAAAATQMSLALWMDHLMAGPSESARDASPPTSGTGWAWALAGRNQVVWMAAILMGFLTVCGGLAVSGWYLWRVRPVVARAEDGDLSGR